MVNITAADLAAALAAQGINVTPQAATAAPARGFAARRPNSLMARTASAQVDKATLPPRHYTLLGDEPTNSGWPAKVFQCNESGRKYKIPSDLCVAIKASK